MQTLRLEVDGKGCGTKAVPGVPFDAVEQRKEKSMNPEKESRIPVKSYSALTGAEVRQIVMKQIEEAMDNDDRFLPHLTYPVVEWEWELKLRHYPAAANGDTIRLELRERAQSKGEQMPVLDDPITGNLTGKLATDVPDATRIEHRMPIKEPTNVGGRFVDKEIVVSREPIIPEDMGMGR